MLSLVIATVIVIVTILLGLLLAFVVSSLDKTVQKTRAEMEKEEKAYNPAITLGHRIKVEADPEEQIREARRLAAKRAAALPRGANMRIGRLGATGVITASRALEEDPWTASKIAAFHGWDGARTGIPAGGVPEAGAVVAAAPAAAAPTGKIELVPGKDYPYIEITDDMSPDEKRKARIANAKAKSAAMKAAKAAGVTAPAAAPATAVPAAAAPAAPAPVATGIEPPKLIEITDDMSPDEKRKARIANAKAKSAYNKALKAAGFDPKAVAAGQVVPQAAPAPAPAPASTPAPAPAPVAAAPAAVDPAALGIEPPQLIEITDDMSPDEKRKARIANAKAKSAYNKALKAAGIDPKSVKG